MDHDIMIRRLAMSFGITGTLLQWLKSYLSGHSQHVIVNGERSESLNLPFGVPQGCCLGPLLFTLYSSKFCEVIKPHLPEAHAYADDSQLYLLFTPNNEASKSMELYIRAIRTWMWMDLMMIRQNLWSLEVDNNLKRLVSQNCLLVISALLLLVLHEILEFCSIEIWSLMLKLQKHVVHVTTICTI